jgi:hypothetical protein
MAYIRNIQIKQTTMTTNYNIFEILSELKSKAFERGANLTDVTVLNEKWGWFSFKLNGYNVEIDNFVDFFNETTDEAKKLIPAEGIVNEILYFCYA